MRIKFKRRKKIKQEDLKKAVISHFINKDNNCSWVASPEIKKGITKPDLAVSCAGEKYLIELKSHPPMLSDVSMVKQASIEFNSIEGAAYVPVIIYPFERIRSDVKGFANESGVKLVSIDDIEEFDETMNYYL